MHAIAHPFRAAMKLAVCCYEMRAEREGEERGDGPEHPMQGDIQRMKLPKVHFIKIL